VRWRSHVAGHHLQCRPLFPADPFPEPLTLDIVGKHEQVALAKPRSGEGLQAAFDQPSSDAGSPGRLLDGEMMEESAPPVAAAEDRAHDPSFVLRHEAHSGIPGEESRHRLRLVCLAEADALGPAPKRVCAGIIIDRELSDPR